MQSRNTNSHPETAPSADPRAPAGGRARACRGRSPPHPGPSPAHPNARPPGCSEFTAGRARRLPGLYLARPSQSARDRTRTPRPARLAALQAGGGGSGNDSRRAWGASLNSRFTPSRALRVLGATSKPFRSASNTSPGFRRGHPLPGRHYTPQEKLLTPHRAALSSVRHPPGAHKPPKPRAREDSPGGANSSRDKNVRARHGTAAFAPHARRLPHALSPSPGAAARLGAGSTDAGRRRLGKAPLRSGLTVSSAAAAEGRGMGRGRHNMAEHHSCSRPLPVAASGKTRPRAGSGSCGGGRSSTTSPSRLLPPLPPPSPRCHGNEAPRRLAPPLPPVPASRDSSGGGSASPSHSPPTSYPRPRLGNWQAAEAAGGGGKGDAVSGRAGLAQKAGW